MTRWIDNADSCPNFQTDCSHSRDQILNVFILQWQSSILSINPIIRYCRFHALIFLYIEYSTMLVPISKFFNRSFDNVSSKPYFSTDHWTVLVEQMNHSIRLTSQRPVYQSGWPPTRLLAAGYTGLHSIIHVSLYHFSFTDLIWGVNSDRRIFQVLTMNRHCRTLQHI